MVYITEIRKKALFRITNILPNPAKESCGLIGQLQLTFNVLLRQNVYSNLAYFGKGNVQQGKVQPKPGSLPVFRLLYFPERCFAFPHLHCWACE